MKGKGRKTLTNLIQQASIITLLNSQLFFNGHLTVSKWTRGPGRTGCSDPIGCQPAKRHSVGRLKNGENVRKQIGMYDGGETVDHTQKLAEFRHGAKLSFHFTVFAHKTKTSAQPQLRKGSNPQAESPVPHRMTATLTIDQSFPHRKETKSGAKPGTLPACQVRSGGMQPVVSNLNP
jgi:hypothetical protein